MIWLELRANETTYTEGWNFIQSVWAPTKKENGGQWPFWNLIGQVVKGDLIFHLKETNNVKRFVGYSTAATDGYVTQPPEINNHVWGFSQEFYKVDLCDFQELNPPIPLSDYFLNNNDELRSYFLANKELPNKLKKRLFYVIQNGKLQCLNGAYFSEFDFYLSLKLNYTLINVRREIKPTVTTDTHTREIEQRIGHEKFSENVKANFNYKCCFPECYVEEKGFLVSGHIARWADNIGLRGNTSNGLCLCLMHDKAFEKGYFTFDKNYNVVLLRDKFKNIEWLLNFLSTGENKPIKSSSILPSIEALKLHWERIGYE